MCTLLLHLDHHQLAVAASRLDTDNVAIIHLAVLAAAGAGKVDDAAALVRAIVEYP
jgi:hypothetical protein